MTVVRRATPDTPATLMIGLLQPVFVAIEDLGVQDPEVAAIARSVDLTDPLGRIDQETVNRLWARVEAIDPLFGLRASGYVRATNFSALAPAAEFSGTVAEAFGFIYRYCEMLYQVSEGGMFFEERPFGYRIILDLAECPAIAMDYCFAVLVGVFRFLAGEPVQSVVQLTRGDDHSREHLDPRTMQFRRPAPPDEHLAMYRSVFGPDVRFGAARNMVDLPRSAMDRRIPTANPTIVALAEQLMEEAVRTGLESAFAVRVSSVIQQLLPNGEPRLAEVAAHLHMSSRSLQRRLEFEGLSYGDVRRHTKLLLARTYLEQTAMPMSEIAYLLGFSSHSSFSRAFHAWTGESPSAVRSPSGPEPLAS